MERTAIAEIIFIDPVLISPADFRGTQYFRRLHPGKYAGKKSRNSSHSTPGLFIAGKATGE